jgi:hypothetical protein
MKTMVKLIFLTGLVFGLQANLLAQCKSFTKSDCKPKLNPYIYNGQLNSAVLNQGDIAELMLTFYSNQDYRIVVCSEELGGNVKFRLLDMNGAEVFSNSDHNFIDHWDFTTNSTQQLTIEVSIPENTTNETIKSGCVSILVGFMDKQ